MNIFSKLTKIAVGVTIETPISLVKDIATMGGSCTGADEPYTATSLRKIFRNIDTLTDDD